MNHNKLIQYLSNEASENEREEVKDWLGANPKHSKILENLEQIYKASGMDLDEKMNFDAEADWKALRHRIVNKNMKPLKSDKINPNLWSAKSTGLSQVLRIAAILLVTAFIGIFAWSNFYTETPEEVLAMREIVSGKGQRVNLVLSDGTNVNVNADSKFHLPEVFHSDKREVFLIEGEAYFEVANDPDRPFLIHSGGAVVRVLGTSFAVRAYPEDETVRVAVNEGIVSLASENDESIETTLVAGQLGHFDIKENTVTRNEVVDMELFISLIDGYMVFKDTPLKVVALH
ncbi:MAG: FecR domain-containing protein, partial [Candidatus Babeliales bacterium]